MVDMRGSSTTDSTLERQPREPTVESRTRFDPILGTTYFEGEPLARESNCDLPYPRLCS